MLERKVGPPHFASDDDAVGGAESLRRYADCIWVNASLGAFSEKLVDYFIRDSVADFVWMAFGNGFTGEKIILPGQLKAPLRWVTPSAPKPGGSMQCFNMVPLPASVRYVKRDSAYSFVIANELHVDASPSYSRHRRALLILFAP
jgi:hypothetical protein